MKFDSEQSHSMGNVVKRARLLQDALHGDIEWLVSPATVAPLPTAVAWTRTVKIQAVNAAGEIHDWFNEVITSGVSIGDTSSAGTASIPSTTLTVVNGEAEVVVSGDAAAWLDTETDTLTVAEYTFQGTAMSADTSIETFTA